MEQWRKKFGNICWITNLPVFKKKELIFTEKYSKEKYPKYDNYDAINIDRIKDIPIDYDGIMGVPISIINQLPKEYEILGMASGNSRNNELYGEVNYIYNNSDHGGAPMVNGKRKYTRIFIREVKNTRDFSHGMNWLTYLSWKYTVICWNHLTICNTYVIIMMRW